MFHRRSREKELKMIWEVSKGAKRSFLVGTAHFFPHSFRTSLSRYIKHAHTVLFEGPLDKDSMARVVNAGLAEDKASHVFDELDSKTIDRITRVLDSPGRDRFPFLFFHIWPEDTENRVYAMIKGMKPWMAFFTVWTKFLEKKGWRYSVDLEAYGIAREMGKNVVFLETIEEQIDVLEGLSHERIVDFLKGIEHWNAYAQEYVKCYLDGDLEKLRSIVSRFSSHRFSAIEGRDQILYERMLAYLERGDAVAFVGAPHIRGISRMLRADGYQTQGQCPSLEH